MQLLFFFFLPGCGVGGSSRQISRRFGTSMTGISLSPVQVYCYFDLIFCCVSLFMTNKPSLELSDTLSLTWRHVSEVGGDASGFKCCDDYVFPTLLTACSLPENFVNAPFSSPFFAGGESCGPQRGGGAWRQVQVSGPHTLPG